MNKLNTLKYELKELESKVEELRKTSILYTPVCLAFVSNEIGFRLPLISILLSDKLSFPISELIDEERVPTVEVMSSFQMNSDNKQWISDLKLLANSDRKYSACIDSSGNASLKYVGVEVEEYISTAEEYMNKKRELEDYMKENQEAIRVQKLFASLSSDEKLSVMRDIILKGG